MTHTSASVGTRPPVKSHPRMPRVLAITNYLPTPDVPRTTVFIQRQVEFLRAAGVEVDTFPFEGARRPWRYLSGWIRLRRLLARKSYDLVHAQFGQSALLALPKRLPLIVTFRGSDLLGIVGANGRCTLAGRLLQRLSRAVARRADAVVVVSEHMRRLLPPAVSAVVIPSGLDLGRMRPQPRDESRRCLDLPLERRLVLFAANPAVPRKRYGLAKRAVEILQETMPVDLVLAWGVPHERMPLFMNACDALVLVSVHEGSPNVVKEALACNLPVVSLAIGDVPERLRDIDGCEICADDQPETVAAALGRVLQRGSRIRGREKVIDLDERILADKLIGIYQRAVRRSGLQEARA